MNDLITHGGNKARRFHWSFNETFVNITNERGRQLQYTFEEIFDVLEWLSEHFNDEWFPLGNNVAKLGRKEEIIGLGVAILSHRPGDIGHAQGASYLGVLLEQIKLLEWNGAKSGIKWRIIHRMQTLEHLKSKIFAERD